MTPSASGKALAVLALFALATPSTAGNTEATYGVGVIAGFDSNPLLVADDGPSGAFTQLSLNGGVTRYMGEQSSTAVFGAARLATRTDESPTSRAGYDSGSARAGVAFSPRFTGHRLVVSTGGRLSGYRGTFVDRATGRVYEAAVAPPTDPPATVPIADRLDFDSTGTFLNLRWKQGPKLTWSVETSWDRTDYIEDYAEKTDLDSLDSRAFTVRPGATFRVGGRTAVSFHVALSDLDYDDRPALDRIGNEVPDTRRAYRYTRYQLAVRVEPADAWHLNVGVDAGGREDTYAGYYDSETRSGYFALNRDLGRSSSLRLLAAMRDVQYDHATVTGDPADEIRSSDERRFVGRYVHSLAERLRWFVEGGVERTDSRDPVFAYDRDWVLTGIQFGR
jgi:hypothetical protein